METVIAILRMDMVSVSSKMEIGISAFGRRIRCMEWAFTYSKQVTRLIELHILVSSIMENFTELEKWLNFRIKPRARLSIGALGLMAKNQNKACTFIKIQQFTIKVDGFKTRKMEREGSFFLMVNILANGKIT